MNKQIKLQLVIIQDEDDSKYVVTGDFGFMAKLDTLAEAVAFCKEEIEGSTYDLSYSVDC